MDLPLKVLIPLDFSRHSGETLNFALGLRRLFAACYLLLHVVPNDDSDIYLTLSGSTSADAESQRRLAEAEAEMTRQVDQLRLEQDDLVVAGLVRSGVPFREICRCAEEENAQLIVIGTHGRTGLSHLLIGSTAERVVQHASCPVLSIKPHIL